MANKRDDNDQPETDKAKSGNRPEPAVERIEKGEDTDPNPLAPPVNIEAGS
jgi:hypothetical protein